MAMHSGIVKFTVRGHSAFSSFYIYITMLMYLSRELLINCHRNYAPSQNNNNGKCPMDTFYVNN